MKKFSLYDKDIREDLFIYLEELYGKIRILEEVNIGDSRADAIGIIDGALIGIEIKSDADTYTRLKSQVKDYDAFFDYNYLVVGSSHGAHAMEHVPDNWGIISVELVEDRLDFYILRATSPNENVSLAHKLSLLWRPELAHIQQIMGMYKYDYKSKAFVREKILFTVPKERLDDLISEELFERDYEAIRQQISDFREAKGLKKRRNLKRRVHRKKKKL
ncbi:sce7726 family protein [Lachnospira multipara]|uniref:Sce7726 family protein n=1 Tax=Lachnospira multipara TaxID=28051 RepID=A0A1H5UHK1_9FIRM|nr:sce7726 family protein [Lachnospira multipara]SEF73958.1 hypothetical protein SAMN05216537_10769 [Lachnospira multipara]